MMTSLDRVRVPLDDPNEFVSATLLRIGYRPSEAMVVTTLREHAECLQPGASVIVSLARARSDLSEMGHIPQGVKACVTLFVTPEESPSDTVRATLRWAMRNYEVVAWSAVSGPELGTIDVRADGRWAWCGATSPVRDLARSAVGNAAVVAGLPFRWDSRDALQRWAHSVSASHVRLLNDEMTTDKHAPVDKAPSHDVCRRAWDVLMNDADEVSADLVQAFHSREFRDAAIAACLVGCGDDGLRLSKADVRDVFETVFSGRWAGQLHPDAHKVVEALRFCTLYMEGPPRWNVLVSLAFIAWACSDTAAAWELCHDIPLEADVSLRDLLKQAMSVGLNIRCNDVA